MKLSEIQTTLRELNAPPTKSLGQNFLHDKNLAAWIVAQTQIGPHDRWLEIGPGLGALTDIALQQSPHGTLLEKDDRLIAFLRNRYPGVTIGFSTHEYHDWHSSMLIAYAKGARTFERHIDIDADGIPVSPYCTLPEQADVWFKAFKKAKEMCGSAGSVKRVPSREEVTYLDALVRGVYARRDLSAGHRLTDDDIFLAIPLQKGQLSCRELIAGEELVSGVAGGEPILIGHLDNPYSRNPALRMQIEERGI